MYKLVKEKGTPKYTGRIQGASKARPQQKEHKKHS